MPLAKLFRVTDTDDQRWHIAAPSFSAALEAMRDWENEPFDEDSGGHHDDHYVKSLEAVEDLIVGGDREESIGSEHELFPFAYPPQPHYSIANDELARRVIDAAQKLVANDGAMGVYLAPLMREKLDALIAAVEKYNEIPF